MCVKFCSSRLLCLNLFGRGPLGLWCGAAALFLLNRLGFVLLFGSFLVEPIVDENALDKKSHGRGGEETGGEVAFAMPAPKA